jgi:DNA adenine methylase
VDPPYVFATRADLSKDYAHELTDADHAELLAFLKTLVGKVVLSGYPHPLYDDALTGWTRVERKALADGARERTEVIWKNPAACEAVTALGFATGNMRSGVHVEVPGTNTNSEAA